MSTKRIPKLFIGPWIGEFGVELLRWQSIARTLAQSRQWSEIIVATHPDRFFLYNDFATKFVPHRPNTIHSVGHKCHGHAPQPIHLKYIDMADGDVWLDANAMPEIGKNTEHIYYPISSCVPTFRDFGSGSTRPRKTYDILLHARATPKAGQKFKNWPSTNFNALVEALPRNLAIASVGAVDGAHKIKGTDDLRGIPLTELAAHCRHAKLMIGPSSGSMHFAMHCGLPVVTWICQEEKCNYYPVWNPFDVPICCLSGWQPDPQVVLYKVTEMLRLLESRKSPLDMLVIGSKRSGHHGVIEWIARMQPTKRFVLWNDCVKDGVLSFPDEAYALPTPGCLPKQLHKAATAASVHEWNVNGRGTGRCMSFEGISLQQLKELPEARQAQRIVLVLRDLANTAASLKKGLPELQNTYFLHSDFQRLMERCREYLREALGKTNCLGELRSKVVFVSYNRWHTDPAYRRQIACALGLNGREPGRGAVSDYVHVSSFQPTGTPAEQLETLTRWKTFVGNRMFWTLVSDPKTHLMEKQFHGKAMPDYAAWQL